MSDAKNRGEGNPEADRRYRKKTSDFVESGKAEERKSRVKPDSESEAEAIRKAEKKAKERARERDPAEKRDYRKPGSH